MTNPQSPYIYGQLIAVAPLPLNIGMNGQFKIKITSDRGETNWLNITDDQFRKIELVLFGEEEDV